MAACELVTPVDVQDVQLASHKQSAALLQTGAVSVLRNEIKQRNSLEQRVP